MFVYVVFISLHFKDYSTISYNYKMYESCILFILRQGSAYFNCLATGVTGVSGVGTSGSGSGAANGPSPVPKRMVASPFFHTPHSSSFLLIPPHSSSFLLTLSHLCCAAYSPSTYINLPWLLLPSESVSNNRRKAAQGTNKNGLR